jgi:hypothetical protein
MVLMVLLKTHDQLFFKLLNKNLLISYKVLGESPGISLINFLNSETSSE